MTDFSGAKDYLRAIFPDRFPISRHPKQQPPSTDRVCQGPAPCHQSGASPPSDLQSIQHSGHLLNFS